MTFVPAIIMFGSIGIVALQFDFPDTKHLNETNSFSNNGTHSIWITELKDYQKDDQALHNMKVLFAMVMIVLVVSVFGMVWLGSDLGEWIAYKKGWVTDFTLERAEKKVTKIKEALNK